jgi:hypothetical protein
MENQVTKEKAVEILTELTSKSPGELWEMYPERLIFEQKIVVDYTKVKAEPDVVLEQFINYLHIPKRKPWIVDMLSQKIREELSLPARQPKNEEVISNY